jgi:hypothetical protein
MRMSALPAEAPRAGLLPGLTGSHARAHMERGAMRRPLDPRHEGPLAFRLSAAYSSVFQQERKKAHALHLHILPASIRYRLPETPAAPCFVISAMHGGVPDLHPCLLSQLMQYPLEPPASLSPSPFTGPPRPSRPSRGADKV